MESPIGNAAAIGAFYGAIQQLWKVPAEGAAGASSLVNPAKLGEAAVKNSFHKLLFVIGQLLFYAIRPTFVLPKALGFWDAMNALCAVAYDVVVFTQFGPQAILYLLVSAFLGGGLHPSAGHFIAEHYVMEPGQETYSYYGPLNYFTYNVGYHNEHHDFPRIPGSRLPEVRKMAPEYYDNLAHYDSWSYAAFAYITDDKLGPFSRMMRFKGGKKAK